VRALRANHRAFSKKIACGIPDRTYAEAIGSAQFRDALKISQRLLRQIDQRLRNSPGPVTRSGKSSRKVLPPACRSIPSGSHPVQRQSAASPQAAASHRGWSLHEDRRSCGRWRLALRRRPASEISVRIVRLRSKILPKRPQMVPFGLIWKNEKSLNRRRPRRTDGVEVAATNDLKVRAAASSPGPPA